MQFWPLTFQYPHPLICYWSPKQIAPRHPIMLHLEPLVVQKLHPSPLNMCRFGEHFFRTSKSAVYTVYLTTESPPVTHCHTPIRVCLLTFFLHLLLRDSLFPLWVLWWQWVRMCGGWRDLVHSQSLQLSLDLGIWDGGRFRLCWGGAREDLSCWGGSYHLRKQ